MKFFNKAPLKEGFFIYTFTNLLNRHNHLKEIILQTRYGYDYGDK